MEALGCKNFHIWRKKSTKSVEGVLVNVNENLTKRANRGEIKFQQPDMYVRLMKEVHIYRNTSMELWSKILLVLLGIIIIIILCKNLM